MKRRNPRYGCLRIAQQINLAFGTDINKDVVRRVLAKHYRPPPNGKGPSWLTFIGHMKDSLWSVDLFRCESIHLRSHWVMVVMGQCTRRIAGFGIQAGIVDGPTLCRMLYDAIARKGTPIYLSSDNDPLFEYHRWKATLSILDIDEIKAIAHVPLSHPFIERLIGTLRRECLDQTLFWNSLDLKRKLTQFQHYYNEHRVHSSLQSVTPMNKGGDKAHDKINLHRFQWQSYCRGLFQLPVAT